MYSGASKRFEDVARSKHNSKYSKAREIVTDGESTVMMQDEEWEDFNNDGESNNTDFIALPEDEEENELF